jgi:hypothetical protein
MKLLTLAAALLALASTLPAASATDVTVTLDVTYGYHLAPSATTCAVQVPDGASVAAVLDAAVAAGCIQSWAAVDYGTPEHPDRFVQCIETLANVCGQDPGLGLEGTFWAFYFDGALADKGVDATFVHAGDDAQLTYGDWFAPFLGLP